VAVFLVDDHAVVRAGLAAYLATEPGMCVVGEASNGAEAERRIATLEPRGELPDVVLMDLVMPEGDGISATAAIKERWPEVEVVAVTSFGDPEQVRAALDAGASGYLLKDCDPSDVAAAIRAAVAGGMHLDPVVARALADFLRRPRAAQTRLTARETDVIRLVATGATNRQIARELQVAERTARTHVSNILGKLGLSSRTQAAMWAASEGLLGEEGDPS
jgi:DNA-binding NarL/FixJ family response regulator